MIARPLRHLARRGKRQLFRAVPKSMCAEFQVAAVAVAGGVAGQRCGMVLGRRSWTSNGDSAKRKRARKMAKVEMCWKCVSLPADEFSGRSCRCERCCWWSANPGRWQAAAPRASGDSGGRARPMTQQLTEQRYCPFWPLMRRWLYLGECSSVRVESRLVLDLLPEGGRGRSERLGHQYLGL